MNYLFCDNGIVGHIQKGGRGIIASAFCLVNENCEILKSQIRTYEAVKKNV